MALAPEQQHETTAQGPLLNPAGALAEPGWARAPLLAYDRSRVAATWLRLKEWDYYCVVSREFVLALTIGDIGYAGMLSATAMRGLSTQQQPWQLTETVTKLFTRGAFGLAASSETDSRVSVDVGGAHFAFETATVDDGRRRTRRLVVEWPQFGASGGAAFQQAFGGPSLGLRVDVELSERVGDDSIVVATPFAESPFAFYYNQKINNLPVRGTARIGATDVVFGDGDAADAWGTLDWGRGVWPYASSWVWASASGTAVRGGEQRVTFGFNLGHGFGVLETHTENAVFVDGRLHKLGRVAVTFDETDWLKPWHATDGEGGRVDLTLEPIIDRFAPTNLVVLSMVAHQVFGRWRGRVVLDDSSVVTLEGLLGWAEKVVNRW